MEHPGPYRVCLINMGLATGSPAKQCEWGNQQRGATDWEGNFLIAKDFKRNREKKGESYRKQQKLK